MALDCRPLSDGHAPAQPPGCMALDPSRLSQPVSLAPGTRVGAVVSLYHQELTLAMLRSAERTLGEAGLEEGTLEVHTAPGAFELPLLADALAARPEIDAVLCFALVLKGETRHDVVVADATVQGLMRVGLDSKKPVLCGVLTCATLEQAQARALSPEQGGSLDKGREVARACIEALNALESIRQGPAPAADAEPSGTAGDHQSRAAPTP